MNNFKECKRVMIGKKERILYKLPNSNKLYIKSSGKMIGYTEYKKNLKIKGKKYKGGYIYNEGNINDVVEIDGIKYIKDLDYTDKEVPYIDPIMNESIKQENAILFDTQFYDIDSLYKYIQTPGIAKKMVPHTRREFTDSEIKKIEDFRKRNTKTLKLSGNEMIKIDLTNSNGNELKDNMISENKFNIFIKSIPYNSRGAYHPFESGPIKNDDRLYNSLINSTNLKDSYVNYYNNIKAATEKRGDMPQTITINDIESITLTILPLNYVPYYMR
jgi:hypothetical protein